MSRRLLLMCLGTVGALLVMSHLMAETPARNWRLQEVLYQDGVTDGFLNSRKDILHYRGNSPTQLDSITIYTFNPSSQTFSRSGCRIYFYDDSGNKIIGLDKYWTSSGYQLYNRYRYEYDYLGRLSHWSDYMYRVNDNYLMNQHRYHYFYLDTPNYSRLNKEIIYEYNFEDPIPMYIGYTQNQYYYSNSQKLHLLSTYTSEDSLTWTPSYERDYTYRTDDTSNYATYIDYFSNTVPLNYSETQLQLDAFGGISTLVYLEWSPYGPEGGNWSEYAVDVCTYDTANRLSSVVKTYNFGGDNTITWTYAYDANNNRSECIKTTNYPQARFVYTWGQSTANEDEVSAGSNLSLQAYPNPFNTKTTLSYAVKEPISVIIDIYNIKVQKVKTLINTTKTAGNHTANWDGTDNNGAKVSGGVYFCRMTAGSQIATRKIILMK
jgi:hypothetical protein